MHRLVLVMVLALLVGACGSGEISLSEYAAEAESLLTAMNLKIDALDAEAQTQSLTVQGAREFWESKVEARRELIDGLEALEHPEEAAEMHAAALRIISRLAAADEGVAQLIGTMESDEELAGLLQSPEFLATEAVDEEAIAMCQSAQADFDATAEREIFVDMPWIPGELKDIVVVFLGCSKQERGVAP